MSEPGREKRAPVRKRARRARSVACPILRSGAARCQARRRPFTQSEQRRLRCWWRVSEVAIGLRRRDAPTRRALEKTVLNEKRLVYFLDRARVLPHRGTDRRDSHRAAVELLDDRLEDARIHVVEPELVDVEHDERVRRDLARDAAVGLDLREIANASEQ